MSKSKFKGMSRRNFIGASIGSVVVAGIGCSSNSPNANGGTGGSQNLGGGESTGGAPGTGGNPATGGTSSGSSIAHTGGAPGAGGDAATGGAPGSGGTTNAGGAATGGKSAATGGAATGGKSAATGGAASGGAATGGAASGGIGAGGKSATGGVAATGGTSSTGSAALVSLVRGTDWVQATMDAIDLAGGLPDLTGKTVMIRPNVIENAADPTTSPDVIHGVLKAVKAKGAKTMIVAEDGWNASGGGGTLACMQKLGIQAVCDAEGATTMDLGAQPKTTHNGLDFSDPVFNADYVIAVPKCKRHTVIGGFTMALKLWYGNTKNNRSHSDASMPGKLHAVKKADFTVLDATSCMITGGPSSGTMVQSKIVAASKDAIAADVTGLLILKYSGSTLIADWAEAWSNTQIKGALGQKIPGWLSAAPSAQSQQQFPYAQQGVTEAATIMGY